MIRRINKYFTKLFLKNKHIKAVLKLKAKFVLQKVILTIQAIRKLKRR